MAHRSHCVCDLLAGERLGSRNDGAALILAFPQATFLEIFESKQNLRSKALQQEGASGCDLESKSTVSKHEESNSGKLMIQIVLRELFNSNQFWRDMLPGGKQGESLPDVRTEFASQNSICTCAGWGWSWGEVRETRMVTMIG